MLYLGRARERDRESEIDFLLLDVDPLLDSCELAGSLCGSTFCTGVRVVYETGPDGVASGEGERVGESHSRLLSETELGATDLGRYGIPAAAA